MCGIAGLVGKGKDKLPKMLSKLTNRGPDASGDMLIESLQCNLGHTRLSIIDLDRRSDQPFRAKCGRYYLTYNGEIYNYLQLKKILVGENYVFHTKSDTEVLLNWLIYKGKHGLKDLDGMFSFCFLDTMKKSLLLARDQIGEKPLYYSHIKSSSEISFAFASEINSLLVLKDVDTSLDQEGLADYLQFLYTAAPNTLYKGIKELSPGHYMEYKLDDDDATINEYYSIEKSLLPDFDITYEGILEAIHTQYYDAVESRLISDVPLSIYLSGGMDSNAIVGTARNVINSETIKTFTMSYTGKGMEIYNESNLAEVAAREHGVHFEKIIFDQYFSYHDMLDKVVGMFGQPFGNFTALASYYMAKEVSKTHKVALVGDGGDELFAGYPRYKALLLHKSFNKMPNIFIELFLALMQLFPENGKYSNKIRRGKQFLSSVKQNISTAFLNWSTYIDSSELKIITDSNTVSSLYNRLEDTFNKFSHDPIKAASIVDLKSFVPYNLMQSADRTSMASSLELRSPFLAKDLVELLLRVPSNYKISRKINKPLLAECLSGEIPDFIKNQPKRGFNPPLMNYLSNSIDELEDHICNKNSELSKILNQEFVNDQVKLFKQGKRDNSTLLWGFATLETWLNK